MEIPDDLVCVYSTEIDDSSEQPVLQIPSQEIELGAIEPGSDYRIAIFEKSTQGRPDSDQPAVEETADDTPPVEVGEELTVEIESIGEEGDGVARIGPGYVVFVPDTEVSERVTVEMQTVLDNVGFAEVLERHEPPTFD